MEWFFTPQIRIFTALELASFLLSSSGRHPAISEAEGDHTHEAQRSRVDSKRFMDLSELPVHLLEDLFSQVSLPDLSRVERASKTLFTLTRSDRAFWKAAIQARWGPVQPPGDSASVDGWISLGTKLEVHVRGLILRSVRQSMEELSRHLRPQEEGKPPPWCESVHKLLSWLPLRERRRLASFVCADWQPPATLPAFLRPLRFGASSPEAALRALLLEFPFLPIDAGDGADRVIGEFSRRYVEDSPHALSRLLPDQDLDAAGATQGRDAVCEWP